LLLVLASHVRRAGVTALVCCLLVAIPHIVAWARMYRGMHHLTDSAAGLLLGVGALVVTVFAARAAGAASDQRDAETLTDTRSPA
jgi:undecaprenyl-diphosphatase